MRVCPACGKENPDDGRFCSVCRKSLRIGGAGVLESVDETPEKAKHDMLSSIRSGEYAERRISPAWSIVALFAILPSAVIFFVSMLNAVFNLRYGGGDIWEFFYVYGRNILMMLFGVLFGVLIFKLLSKINTHMRREEEIRKATMTYLLSASRIGSDDPEAIKGLISASAFDGQASTYEERLPPRRWAFQIALVFVAGSLLIMVEMVLVYNWDIIRNHFAVVTLVSYGSTMAEIIGLVMLIYVTNALMRTLYTHEVRWIGFVNSISEPLRRLGKNFKMPRLQGRVKERPFILYAVLTVVTIGFFAFYWLYALIDDQNKHIEWQVRVENTLGSALD